MAKHSGVLQRGINTIVKCGECGVRFQSHRSPDGASRFREKESILCADCWDQAGIFNEHQDGTHKDSPDPKCNACKGI